MKTVALLLMSAVAAAAACTTGAFTYCREVTMASSVPANSVVYVFTDYPSPDTDVSSFITSIASAAAKVQADGDDIVFVDPTSGTEFAAQGRISYTNATGAGGWAFRTTAPTTSFWVRYGNGSATDSSDFSASTGVFQDYRCVVLNADTTDVSGNSCTPTEVNTPTSGAGLFGQTWIFDGATNEHLLASGMDALTDTSYSFTFVAQSDLAGSSTTGQNMLTWPTTGSPIIMYWSQGINASRTRLFGPDAVAWANPPTDAATGTWYVITCAYDGTTSASCWRNGNLVDSIEPTTAPATRNDDLYIGIHDGASLREFDGKINLFAYRPDQGDANDEYQAVLTEMLQTPNAFFTWGDEVTTASYTSVGIFRRSTGRVAATASAPPSGEPEVSVLCAGADVDLGDGACPAYNWNQKHLLGSGR